MDKSLAVSPAFLNLYPASEIDSALEKLFHIFPCTGGNLFEHRSALADDNSLVALALTVNYGFNVKNVAVFAFTHFFNADGCTVGNFFIKGAKKLFADNFTCNNSFGLVGESVLREEENTFKV